MKELMVIIIYCVVLFLCLYNIFVMFKAIKIYGKIKEMLKEIETQRRENICKETYKEFEIEEKENVFKEGGND